MVTNKKYYTILADFYHCTALPCPELSVHHHGGCPGVSQRQMLPTTSLPARLVSSYQLPARRAGCGDLLGSYFVSGAAVVGMDGSGDCIVRW